MSAHFRHSPPTHNPLTPHFKSSILKSRIHRSPTMTTSTHNALTPFEFIILIFALSVLVAVVSWLAWIMLESLLTFAKEKLSDMDLGNRLRRDRHRAEQVPKRAFKITERVGRLGMGSLLSVGEAILGKGDGGRRDGERGEQRRLLVAEGERGYGVFEGRYGYYEDTLYPSSFGIGQDSRPKYADGMSESSGCVGPLHGHREECVGECTLQTRRRSHDS